MTEDLSIQERIKKLDSLRAAGVNPYPYTFNATHKSKRILDKYQSLEDGQATEDSVAIAGRVMTRRVMGKLAFIHIQDESGQIQLFISKGDVGDDTFSMIDKFIDLGDIVGASGVVVKTKKGEISVRVSEFTLLTKSIRPLPDKFHGLKDQETIYRRRSLDLITNPESRATFILRSKILAAIRAYMIERDFLEVETPMLQTIWGGAAARPFITHHNTFDIDLYMRIAPELFLKRLTVGGMERVFEINKNFRNEGIDYNHNPEFTMMELYQAYTDYNGMMDLAEDIIRTTAKSIVGKELLKYRGHEIDVSKPFRKISMVDAIKEQTGIDCLTATDDELHSKLQAEGVQVPKHGGRGWMINELFETFVEETLIQPTFILDYPKEISPLTKVHRDNTDFVERFELFIGGDEFANAYSELNDPVDQRQRFEDQLKAKELGDDEANPIDEDFLQAIETGLPPTGGMGIGIDRLIMLLTEKDTIRDVILFPTMRPKTE